MLLCASSGGSIFRVSGIVECCPSVRGNLSVFVNSGGVVAALRTKLTTVSFGAPAPVTQALEPALYTARTRTRYLRPLTSEPISCDAVVTPVRSTASQPAAAETVCTAAPSATVVDEV